MCTETSAPARAKLSPGTQVGRLTLEKKSTYMGLTFWLCTCHCGSTKSVRQDHLSQGRVKSCGCLRAETKRTFNNSLFRGV